jgi:hypothetical protein
MPTSLWYILRGDRRSELCFDRSEFRDAKWLHRLNVPLEHADIHMFRFLRKLDVA